MTIIGYARVSTTDQNLEVQEARALRPSLTPSRLAERRSTGHLMTEPVSSLGTHGRGALTSKICGSHTAHRAHEQR